jgi:hypothetical protein
MIFSKDTVQHSEFLFLFRVSSSFVLGIATKHTLILCLSRTLYVSFMKILEDGNWYNIKSTLTL